MISQLKQEVIEEGREHPFVEALVKELRGTLRQHRDQLETATEDQRIWKLQGGAQAIRTVLRLVLGTEGEQE